MDGLPNFKSRSSFIVGMNVVLNRTIVVDSDLRFDNLCGSHLHSQSELYHVLPMVLRWRASRESSAIKFLIRSELG